MPVSASLISLRGVTLTTPDGRPLLENLDLSFGPERVGIAGRNGIGKSTLLRVIAGAAAPGAGTVERTGRAAMLRQTVQFLPDTTLADFLDVRAGLARLARLAAGTGSLDDAAEAEWDLEARIEAALATVGLSGMEPARPAASLSGGQQTRAALAALILAEPDVMLLDEPTNNLDPEGRDAVLRLLSGWRRGAIVVSHDRALLRATDRIVELSSLGARSYGGNYDLYVAQKAEESAAAARALDAAKREAGSIARRIEATRERQARRMARGERVRARGGQPKLFLDAERDRSERTLGANSRLAERQIATADAAVTAAEAAVERLATMALRLPSTQLPAGRSVLAFRGVSYAHPGAPPVFRDVDFTVTGPERVALTGPNGTGKSTLLRLAHGDLSPDAGSVERPVRSVILDQTVTILDPALSLLDNFRRHDPEATVNDAHAALARFLFRNTDALRLAGTLSGGEMLRAGLACTLGGSHPPQLLMLDEPTNHLDLDSIGAIEAALRDFDGALIVASHDADFLDAVGFDRRISFPLVPA